MCNDLTPTHRAINFKNSLWMGRRYGDANPVPTSPSFSFFFLSFLTPGREGRKCLFNDALNTFYLRLYGVRHMVNDYSDSEKGNPLPPHRLLFPINSKGSFICTIPQTG